MLLLILLVLLFTRRCWGWHGYYHPYGWYGYGHPYGYGYYPPQPYRYGTYTPYDPYWRERYYGYGYGCRRWWW